MPEGVQDIGLAPIMSPSSAVLAPEGVMQALLGPLVGGRCYPLVAPQTPATPYMVFQVISNIPLVSLDGPIGVEKRRMQVDIYGLTYGEVKALELRVKDKMKGAALSNIPLSSMDLYEPETKLNRVTLDFAVWNI